MTKYYDKPRKGMKKGKNGKYYYPAKRRARKAPVRKAVQRVQDKTELKDRVAHPAAHDLTTFSGSLTNGPAGSYIIVPESFMTVMSQGDLNGQLHGNEYCPKYLNMKIKLNFENLDPFGGDESPYNLPQSYYITLTQGWVKINLKQSGALSQTHTNVSSGRNQPAFAAGADPHALAIAIAKRALFQANFERDFLSYEKRSYDDVKVLRRFRVYGDQRKKFVIPDAAEPHGKPTVIAPDKHYSLNWRMMNKKQELAPITGATTSYGNAQTWIPFCMITLKADVGLSDTTKLTIEQANHFTYSDM